MCEWRVTMSSRAKGGMDACCRLEDEDAGRGRAGDMMCWTVV